MKKRNGRDGEIRTLDLLIPNQARYQAAPRPDQRAGQYAGGAGAWQTVFGSFVHGVFVACRRAAVDPGRFSV